MRKERTVRENATGKLWAFFVALLRIEFVSTHKSVIYGSLNGRLLREIYSKVSTGKRSFIAQRRNGTYSEMHSGSPYSYVWVPIKVVRSSNELEYMNIYYFSRVSINIRPMNSFFPKQF